MRPTSWAPPLNNLGVIRQQQGTPITKREAMLTSNADYSLSTASVNIIREEEEEVVLMINACITIMGFSSSSSSITTIPRVICAMLVWVMILED